MPPFSRPESTESQGQGQGLGDKAMGQERTVGVCPAEPALGVVLTVASVGR